MLRHTFLHLPGIGEVRERRLWAEGFRTWEDLLRADAHGELRADVERSIERYAAGDWLYFDGVLPCAHKWRAHVEFPARVLYVDIETDGGRDGSAITLLGAYDGSEYRAFVAGRNLDAARALLESYPVVVTFNGSLFDLPLIRDRFRYNMFNFVHIDLRFALRRLGYRGGLKSIEKQLKINRSGRTQGLDGWDAVRLWNLHEMGDRSALELLIQYNREDVVHMEPLMALVRDEMLKKLPAFGSRDRNELA
jgi:hypothetical protein